MDDLNMANAELAATPTSVPNPADDVQALAPQPTSDDISVGEPSSFTPEQPTEPVPEATVPETVSEEPKAEEPAPKKLAQDKSPEKEEPAEEKKSDKMDWYILKVQSNREESIREGLLRRVAITGLGFYFDEVIVPTEKVTEFKGGKKKVIKRKLYPGYLVVHMEINDDTWFLVRETPGIGDFTGAAGRPSPMLPHEVARIVAKQEEKSEKAPKLKIAFREGERVKIKEGTFENFEGDVESIDETNGRVTVMINIFGRSTPVELEYWQIETL
jgi:transcription termination/antitermination protein NusG